VHTQVRPLQVSDYGRISPVMNEWWGGQSVRQLLPRLFFEHFALTSFVIAEGDEIKAFLVGFVSPSIPGVAYIHFVGVAPASRTLGYGRRLYAHFFEAVAAKGCTEVRCITSPMNLGSIGFHERMGFRIVSNDGKLNGIPMTLNYAGEGQHRTQFSKQLDKRSTVT